MTCGSTHLLINLPRGLASWCETVLQLGFYLIQDPGVAAFVGKSKIFMLAEELKDSDSSDDEM